MASDTAEDLADSVDRAAGRGVSNIAAGLAGLAAAVDSVPASASDRHATGSADGLKGEVSADGLKREVSADGLKGEDFADGRNGEDSADGRMAQASLPADLSAPQAADMALLTVARRDRRRLAGTEL
jgi:hypothetical protein